MLIKGENVYDILGIEESADVKTIKRAYAKLVKQYHPEEQPEEWKRIHDAYEYAMKNASEPIQKPSGALEPTEQSQTSEKVIEVPRIEPPPNKPTEMPGLAPSTPVEPGGAQETERSTIFDDIETVAAKQNKDAEEEAKEKLKSAIREVEALSWQKKLRLKEWKVLFERDDLLPIISRKEFLQALGNCFTLKTIHPELYRYLDEQLNVIADYIKSYSTESKSGRDMASVEFARSKIKAAYKYQQSMEAEHRNVVTIGIVVIAVVATLIAAGVSLKQEEQNQQEEQQMRREMMHQQYERTIEQNNQLIEDMKEQNPEVVEEYKQQVKEMLEDGTISQQTYDGIMKLWELDQTESGEEATEE